ncbi:twin-arginine translocase TatA/TatE family subunit [Aeromicrobium erythreum]|uniref:Sec-independent protein translocase protein TatA n=1 Tax=Aeromicrobium erythreum TaxID=2041 RepID=A0A0U4AZG7_9ACTN|nr:twin-arginine translocase TatA/TatE family subunit [Aeromicrobium erythreum]ALX05712.1 hypothetical protein AERYTH_13890 [Aeromicrobium erythreum]
MLRQIGATELLMVLGVAVLLFGGRKLPELARGSGQALRIFRQEMREEPPSSEEEPARTAE